MDRNDTTDLMVWSKRDSHIYIHDENIETSEDPMSNGFCDWGFWILRLVHQKQSSFLRTPHSKGGHFENAFIERKVWAGKSPFAKTF